MRNLSLSQLRDKIPAPIMTALENGNASNYGPSLLTRGTETAAQATERVQAELAEVRGNQTRLANYYSQHTDSMGYDIYNQVQGGVRQAVIAEDSVFLRMKQLMGQNRSIPFGETIVTSNRDAAATPAKNVSDTHIKVDADTPDRNQELFCLPMQVKLVEGVGYRATQQAISRGLPLDVSWARSSARAILRLQASNFMGTGANAPYFQMGAKGSLVKVYGVADHPNRTTGTLTADWEGSTATTRYSDVLTIIADAKAEGFNGPFALVVAGNYYTSLNDFVKADGTQKLREAIMDIPEIQDVLTDMWVPDDHVYLIQLDEDTLNDVVQADLTTVSWNQQHAFSVENFLFFAAENVLLQSDYNNRIGIFDYTKP